jgi:outer membrane protein assembly factor BamB
VLDVSDDRHESGADRREAAADLPESEPPTIDAGIPGDEAPCYHLDPAHTGRHVGGVVRPPLRKLWSVDLGAPVSYPVVGQGRVFVTVSTSPRAPKVVALDQRSGAVLWEAQAAPLPQGTLDCAYDRGAVFTTTSEGYVRAFDAATGAERWSSRPFFAFTSPPTAVGGLLFVSGYDTGTVAFDETDGRRVWGGERGSEGAPAVADGRVFAQSGGFETTALDSSTGRRLWYYRTAETGGGGETVAVYGSRVYLRNGTFYGGFLVLDANTGTAVGALDTSGLVPAFDGPLGFFVANLPRELQARSLSDLSLLWTFTGDGRIGTEPLVVNGHVFVASQSGILYALDENSGAVVWSENVGFPIADFQRAGVEGPRAGLTATDHLLLVPATNAIVAYGEMGGGPDTYDAGFADRSVADTFSDGAGARACVPIGGYTSPPGFPTDGTGFRIDGQLYTTGTTIDERIDPGVVKVADVTGDGRSDIVGVYWINGLWIWAQTPSGGFKEIGPVDVGLDRLSWSGPVTLDVDEDNVADILIGNDEGLQIIRSLRDGKFADAVAVPGPRPERFAVADENGDGRPDVIAVGQGEMTDGGAYRIPVLIYRANAQRWLAPPTVSGLTDVPPGPVAYQMAVGDVTGDGTVDLVLTLGNEVVVYAGRGVGLGFPETGVHYRLTVEEDSVPYEAGLDIGDIDGDGRKDVVVSEDTFVKADSILVLLQDASGRLRAPVPILTYGPAGEATVHGGALLVTDMNLDGISDVVNVDVGFKTFVVLGDKSGTRVTRTADFPNFASVTATALAVGDVNCDGCPDVVSAQVGSLSLFFGKGCKSK